MGIRRHRIRFAAALLLGLSAACGSKQDYEKAKAAVRAAEAELRRLQPRHAAASDARAKALAALEYALGQGGGDAAGAAWWAAQRAEKQAAFDAADRAFKQSVFDYMQAGRAYVQAEQAFRPVGGGYSSPEKLRAWEAELKNYSKSSGAGAFTKEAPQARSLFQRLRLALGALIALAIAFPYAKFIVLRLLKRDDPLRLRQVEEGPAPEAELLAGKYRLERVIGRGGMGSVWDGFDKEGRRVAVKEMTIKGKAERDRLIRELYLKEARTLMRLEHANIIHLIEVVERGAELFLVFEFVAGKTLAQMIAESRRLPWATVKHILAPAARGLGYAHGQGIVHRDIKPANIMMTDAGAVKIMDFGIARALGQAEPGAAPQYAGAPEGLEGLPMARTQMSYGTPAYRPPETAQGLVSPAADIYSLGVSVYEALAGELPFGQGGWSAAAAKTYRPPSAFAPGLPGGVDALVGDMLQPQLPKRIPTAGALLARLGGF